MKSVVICGSRRFKKEIREFCARLREFGVDVYEPYLHDEGDKEDGEWHKVSYEYKKLIIEGLTYGHFQKIRMADIVYIFNKDGYSGNSTNMEIGFAAALLKPIYSYAENKDICCRVLIREVVSSPEELFSKLC